MLMSYFPSKPMTPPAKHQLRTFAVHKLRDLITERKLDCNTQINSKKASLWERHAVISELYSAVELRSNFGRI